MRRTTTGAPRTSGRPTPTGRTYRAGVRVAVVGAGISGTHGCPAARGGGARRPPRRGSSAGAHDVLGRRGALVPLPGAPARGRHPLVRRSPSRCWPASSDDPDAGVRLRTGRELFPEAQPDPWWRDAVPALDRVPAADAADGLRRRLPPAGAGRRRHGPPALARRGPRRPRRPAAAPAARRARARRTRGPTSSSTAPAWALGCSPATTSWYPCGVRWSSSARSASSSGCSRSPTPRR